MSRLALLGLVTLPSALCATPGAAFAVVPGAATVVASLRAALPQPGHLRVTLVEEPPSPPAGAPAPGPPLQQGSPAPSAAPAPQAWRVEVWPDGRLQIDREDLTSGETRTELFPPHEGPLWLRLLTGAEPSAALARAAVERRVTSLAHDDSEVLWVLGAGPQLPAAPQVHVVRASGRLRRVVASAPAGEAAGPVVAVLRGEAGAAPPAQRWPAQITLTAGGRTTVLAVKGVQLLPPEPATPPAPRAPVGEPPLKPATDPGPPR